MTARVVRGTEIATALADAMSGLATDRWLQQHGRVLKRDAHSLVALVEFSGQTLYCKHFQAKHALQNLAFRLGIARAVRAFDAATELASAGITVPRPTACLQRRDGMLLATAGLPAARDIKALWLDESARPPRQRLLDGAATLLSDLHAAGFAHGDCKWSNLLWQGEQLVLVDLEAVQRCGKGDRRQSRDLARFTVNAEDLGVDTAAFRQFLDGYCSALDITDADAVSRMQPELARLRARHRQKYGERGARLV